MDDEAAMRRISRYIRRLRNSTSTKDVAHEDMIPYTMNELHERIDKAEKAIIEGNVIDSETEDAQLADFMQHTMKIKTYPETTQELRKIAAFCNSNGALRLHTG